MRSPDERARHRRIEALFEAALDRPEGDRADFVTHRCAGDRTLAAEVMRLLRAHGRADGILDHRAPGAHLLEPTGGWPRLPPTDGPEARWRDADRAGAGLQAAHRPEAALRLEPGPARYGPYRILHTLGRGGMGTVHLAVREDAFMRRVALKVIHGRARGGEAASVASRASGGSWPL